MAKLTIFDYARKATEAEESLLMLLDPQAEPAGKAESEPQAEEVTESEPSDQADN